MSSEVVKANNSEYCSYRETYYSDRIAFIDEEIVDQVIDLLNLNSSEVKEALWDDLGSLIMRQKQPTAETKATEGNAQTYADDLTDKLQKILNDLNQLHYKNLKELSKENLLREMMEEQSLIETPSPRTKYGKGHGIYLTKSKGQENPILYPFDEELCNATNSLENMINRIQKASSTLAEQKQPKKSGKRTDRNSDDILLDLCRSYKKYMGIIPTATTSGGSPTGTSIRGKIIDLLQLILPLTSYRKSQTRDALRQSIERLKNSGEYTEIWPDN